MVGSSALVLRDHCDGSKRDCTMGTPVTLSGEEGLWKEQSHWDQNRRLEVSPLPHSVGMWGRLWARCSQSWSVEPGRVTAGVDGARQDHGG